MSGLVIEKEKCVGCGACVSACPSAALSMEGGLAAADGAACALCGVCVVTCPTGAFSVEEEAAASLASNSRQVTAEPSSAVMYPASPPDSSARLSASAAVRTRPVMYMSLFATRV